MPRFARVKPNGMSYHIMCRSVSEIKLFVDEEDKEYYLNLLKKYCDKYQCSVYAYCLLDNHLHMHFDPKGFDLSKFMHGLNTAYVIYYNRKYSRHGHLFQGRFESKVISSDAYAIALSAYIHNNSKDVEGYRGREEDYPYSSMGIYISKRKDLRGLIDAGFILTMFGTSSRASAISKYKEFVKTQGGETAAKNMMQCLEQICVNRYENGRRLIFRDLNIEDIHKKMSETFGTQAQDCMRLKYNRSVSTMRSFMAFIMRTLCGYSYDQICRYLGNMTISGISKLCSKGFELFKSKTELQILFSELSGATCL